MTPFLVHLGLTHLTNINSIRSEKQILANSPIERV